MTLPYQEPGRSIEERASDLLARMTLEEKAAQMHALWLILSEDGEHRPRQDDFTGGTDPAAVQEGAAATASGRSRARSAATASTPRAGVRALNRLQKFLREETRLGIPALSHEECLVGLMARGATMFPSALAYGATWNPDLIERAAQAIGREARSVGCHQGLAPVLDVSRDVRWGRTEETFGEDPYLVGVLGTRFVRGLQGEKRDLLATLKHYAGHSWSEGARNHGPVHLGWRELNDVFLLPFEMAVKQAHAGSVMPAYHDIDNESCHASRHLLTEVLRDEWGFDGLIVADYIGISLLYQHHNLAADRAEAAAMAFNAGLDIELPADDCAAHLGEAVGRGLISIETIDAIVRRILVEKLRLGPLREAVRGRGRHRPAVAGDRRPGPRGGAPGGGGAREPTASCRSTPRAASGSRSIGPTADDPLALLCGYSFPVHLILNDAGEAAAQVVTPRAAFEKAFGAGPRRLRPGLLHHRAAQVRLPGVPGRRREEHDARAGVPGLAPDRPHPRGGGVRAGGGRRRGVRRRPGGPVPDRHRGRGLGRRLARPARASSSSSSRRWSRPGSRWWSCSRAAARTTWAGWRTKVAAFVMAFAGGQEGGPALVEVLTGAGRALGPALPSRCRRTSAPFPYYYNHKMKSAGTPIALPLRQPLPVRPRPRLHDVRVRRPDARRAGGGRRRPARSARGSPCATRGRAPGWRCRSSTCGTSSPRWCGR